MCFAGRAGRQAGVWRADGPAEDAVQRLTERTLPKEVTIIRRRIFPKKDLEEGI